MKLRKVLSSIVAGAVAVSAMSFAASAAVLSETETVFDASWSTWVDLDGASFTEPATLTISLKDVQADAKVGVKSKADGWPQLAIGDVYKTDASEHSIVEQGLVVLSNDATYVSVDLTEDMVKELNEKNGLVFGANLTVTGVTLEATAAEEEKTEETTAEAGAFTAEIGYVDGKPAASVKVVDDIKELKVSAKIKEAGVDGFEGFNDWCGEGVIVTLADGTRTAYQWGGASVTWSVDLDKDGTDDATGVGTDAWLATVADNAAELVIPVEKDAIVDFYCCSWDSYEGTQITLSIDGGVVANEIAADEAEDAEEAEDEEADAEEDAEEAEDEEADAEEDEAEEDEDEAAEAFTLEECYNNGTVILVADDGQNAYATSNDMDILDVYGYRVTAQFPMAEINDENVWIGGGIGTNANSTGWASTEWGKASGAKPIVTEFDEQGVVILELVSDTSLFAADDAYAQLWIQCWGGTMNIISVEVLGADGEVIDEAVVGEIAEVEEVEEDEAEEETEEETAPEAGDVSAETDSSKTSPDTGIEDVAVVAGLAIVAGGAVLVSKKRK